MKKIILIITFILALSNFSKIFSWDGETAKYFPLQVGNTWVYNGTSSGPGFGIWIDQYKITGTIVSGGKLYYVVTHTRRVISGTNYCQIRLFSDDYSVRIDSATMNLYKLQPCSPYSETLVDSLKARKNDSSNTCNWLGNKSKCTDTSMATIFSLSKSSKTFTLNYFEGQEITKYIKDIGLSNFSHGLSMYNCTITLKGCVINFGVFGDTSMITGINTISTEVPEQLILYQNYPNPFNPSCRIRFAVPVTGNVIIAIYNIAGSKIAEIVNENLSPGTYETDFDGSNYASGVYYYKIITESFTETKKMVLLK